jgi:hypothetical protein
MQKVLHLDEKTLVPADCASSTALTGSSCASLEGASRLQGLKKSLVGKPKVYDLKGNLLAEEENLVVLSGREFLAQKLGLTQGQHAIDYTDYRITHFGVGDAGTDGGTPPVAVGPFDNDADLVNRVQIGDMAAGGTEPNYIDAGFLKKIEFDNGNGTLGGEITIVAEDHTINTNQGGGIVVQAVTAIRYTMYLQANEPLVKPFKFNEAGLYAVKYQDDGNGNQVPTGDYILFARFTTLDKYLEAADGIMIEWYILV